MSALHCRSQGRAYIDQQNAGLLSLFFTPPWPSQAQCNAFAQSREGGDVPFEVMLQGGSSYTVCCNGSIYQFRKPEARIDVNLINHARSIYVDFEPPTMEELRFGPLFVYRMSDMLANAVFYDAPNAVSARRTTHEGRVALRGIVRSVARFVQFLSPAPVKRSSANIRGNKKKTDFLPRASTTDRLASTNGPEPSCRASTRPSWRG